MRARVKITQREKRQHTMGREKNEGPSFFYLPVACRLFSRGVIFTRARVLLALLSLRKNKSIFSWPTVCDDKCAGLLTNAPINGLSQDGGAGQATGIRLRKAHVGGDFDIHNGPQGGKFDSTAILKSGEDLGMSEWSAILENTQKSFERVSRVQGWLKER